jgi:hypothetical protein
LSITDYYNKLKKLADNLRDVGHPVSEPSQVLNLLRGLSKKFRHVKPVLTSKTHTFMSARSYLLLEELQLQQDDKTKASQAFLASHGGAPDSGGSASHGGSSRSAPSAPGGSSGGDAGGNRNFRSKTKRRGRGGSTSGTDGGGAPQRPNAPWPGQHNP